MSGKVPNQEAAQLLLQNRIENDIRARQFMVEKIYEVVIQRNPQPMDDMQKKKFRDIARRLEEGLYRISTSKEEYMNRDTLETRIQNLIKPPSVNNQNQQDATLDNYTPLLDIGLPVRQAMFDKIYEIVIQRNSQPMNDMQKKKLTDIVRRLEEGLYVVSTSKEEYMNLDTLDLRLQNLMKRPPVTNRDQQNACPLRSASRTGRDR